MRFLILKDGCRLENDRTTAENGKTRSVILVRVYIDGRELCHFSISDL